MNVHWQVQQQHQMGAVFAEGGSNVSTYWNHIHISHVAQYIGLACACWCECYMCHHYLGLLPCRKAGLTVSKRVHWDFVLVAASHFYWEDCCSSSRTHIGGLHRHYHHQPYFPCLLSPLCFCSSICKGFLHVFRTNFLSYAHAGFVGNTRGLPVFGSVNTMQWVKIWD